MSFSKKRHLTEVNQKLEQYFFESKNNHNNRDIISEQSSPLLYRSCGKLGIYSYGCVDVKPEEKNIIKQVQKCLGITKADGYFGPKTLEALESKFPNTEGVFTVADFKTICGKEWTVSQTPTNTGTTTAATATVTGSTVSGTTSGSSTVNNSKIQKPVYNKGQRIDGRPQVLDVINQATQTPPENPDDELNPNEQ